ncbi:MAG: DUF5675 family protein [Bacteroidales bacterium]|nr:DUF5675 family protein [Bacteroidales bacterium]
MEIKLERRYKKGGYTIGILSIDGKYECEVLENRDRGLTSNMTEEEIRQRKVAGRTAIPTGRYRIIFSYSPKFCKCDYAINGMIPLLIGVKGFCAIRMHAGNRAEDTDGCLLPGENKAKGMVLNSTKTCERVFRKMWTAYDYGSPVWITVE